MVSVINPTKTVEDVHRNLMVNYLPDSWVTEDLQGLFEQYGEIETCTVVMNKETQQSRGYGFVKFLSRADAENALQELNGFQVKNRCAASACYGVHCCISNRNFVAPIQLPIIYRHYVIRVLLFSCILLGY